MSREFLLLIVALIITLLIFRWLIKVIKTSMSTALIITGIVLILQLGLGIGAEEVWQQILALPDLVRNLFNQ